jgi:hypothetical protein
MQIGECYEATVKIEIRPANCQTCEFGEEIFVVAHNKIERVCVFDNPEANPEGYAFWPIVENEHWCRRHKFDSVRIQITGEPSGDVGGNIEWQ